MDSLTCFPCEPQQQIPSHPSESSDRCASSAHAPSGNLPSVATVESGPKQSAHQGSCVLLSPAQGWGKGLRQTPHISVPSGLWIRSKQRLEERRGPLPRGKWQAARAVHITQNTQLPFLLFHHKYICLSLSASPTGKHILLNDVKQGFMMWTTKCLPFWEHVYFWNPCCEDFLLSEPIEAKLSGRPWYTGTYSIYLSNCSVLVLSLIT